MATGALIVNLGKFSRQRFCNPDLTLTREALAELQLVKRVVDEANGVTFADTIAVVPAGGIAAADVQAALQELDTEKQPRDAELDVWATKTAPAGAVVGTTDPQTLTNKTLTSGGVALTAGSIGYAAGNGGTVTQATSKATGVTLNKMSGDVTLNAAALAANTVVSFTLTNSNIAATDLVHAVHNAAGTNGAYGVTAQVLAAGASLISVRNLTAGSLSEAIVIRFAVFKAATT